MKKSELAQLIAQYKPEALFSFFNIVSVVGYESKEITVFKNILASVSALADDAELPDEIVTALKRVLAAATSHDKPTVNTLQQLHVHLHPLEPFNFKAPWKWVDLQARLTSPVHKLKLECFFRDCLSPVLDIVTASRLARTCKAGNFIAFNPDSEIFQKSAARLLELVMKGEQDAAKAMIKRNPHLLGARSEATDYSGRTILTKPLQYAVWAGDWYMYQMLLEHMSPKTAQEQIKDLNENGLGEDGEHGPRFDFGNLFQAYAAYIKRASEIYSANRHLTNAEYHDLDRLWMTVYQEQAKLPAHVIQQFMHPNRSFLIGNKPPEFSEPKFPRNSLLEDGKSVFAKSGEYVFGSNFGLIRTNRRDASMYDRLYVDNEGVIFRCVRHDFVALSRLAEVISNNYQQNFQEAASHSSESRVTKIRHLNSHG